MTREVHDIPPAPRLVRWRAVLWHRWPLAGMGAFLAVYFGLVALMLFHARGGKPRDDSRLAHSPHRTEGRVIAVRDSHATWDGEPAVVVTYRFTLPGESPHEAECFARHGRFAVGDRAPVRFLADETHVHCLEGGRLSLVGDWLTPVIALFVLPGLLCLLLWLQGVFALKAVLRDGDVAVARIVDVAPVRLVLPAAYAVRYEFRDHRAETRTGRHWVRARSTLGERIAARARRAIVVHSRVHPQHSRLVLAEDFLPQATPPPNGSVPLEV
jgi:hypothetical protein